MLKKQLFFLATLFIGAVVTAATQEITQFIAADTLAPVVPSITIEKKEHFCGGRTKRRANIKERIAKSGTQKTIRYMDLDELNYRKNVLLEANDLTMAIKYVEKMIPLCDDLDRKGLLMLELADLYYHNGNLKVAEKKYKEFSSLYPSHEQAETAYKQEIMCSYLSILSADRDQTKTKATIALADSYLSRASFTTFSQDIASIKKHCLKRNLESDISIFNFYLNKGSLRAAEHRIGKIETIHRSLLPEAPVLINECKVALLQKKAERFNLPVPTSLPSKADTPAAPATIDQLLELQNAQIAHILSQPPQTHMAQRF